MRQLGLTAALALVSAPVLAQDGDPAAGAEHFRQCVACHIIADESGEVLAGRNARTGPNLFGVIGRQPGTIEGFNYGDALVEYGETGVVWSQDNMVAYLQDPTGFLREALDNRRARGKMAYQVRDEQQAHDLFAFLATFGEGEGG